ncbi:MAG TPA: hypothetical protein EYH08_03320 [Pyrodictium sp.]|nr:hypothetical protein [Pyrodictium sp.]
MVSFNNPIVVIDGVNEGVFVSRVNRFVVKVLTGNRELYCHLHDPGRLPWLRPGYRVWFRMAAKSIARKTPCDVVAIEDGAAGVIVLEDTRYANTLYRVLAGELTCRDPKCSPSLQSEVYLIGSRLDFVTSCCDGSTVVVEVKNTNLVVDKGIALFPDAPSKRAQKHLTTLALLAERGYRAQLAFMVVREDARVLKPHREIDPVFAKLMCSYKTIIDYVAAKLVVRVVDDKLLVYYGGMIPVIPCH